MTFEGAVVTSGASRHTADGEDHPGNPLNSLTSEPAKLGARGWWEADPEWRSDRRLERVRHYPQSLQRAQASQAAMPSVPPSGGLWEGRWAATPSKAASLGQFLLVPGPARQAGRRDHLIED